MAKPIFVIRLNHTVSQDNIRIIRRDLEKNMKGLVNDYHIIFASGTNNHIEFECYNPDDLPEEVRSKTMEEINKIIDSQTKKNKNK